MIARYEKLFKALGDKSRLRILKMLELRPMCVCEIRYVLKLSQPTVSGHLKVLKGAELVEDKKDGLWVTYSIKRDQLNKEILNILKNLDKDSQIRKDLKLVESISRESVSQL
ncbi:MAG TPA: ArsR family transcriptional regulator [Candidatus Omnitrophica bacterium]|nr:ArsR family transcriptional regulator [Candidatus Omnitrophota bacterium]